MAYGPRNLRDSAVDQLAINTEQLSFGGFIVTF